MTVQSSALPISWFTGRPKPLMQILQPIEEEPQNPTRMVALAQGLAVHTQSTFHRTIASLETSTLQLGQRLFGTRDVAQEPLTSQRRNAALYTADEASSQENFDNVFRYIGIYWKPYLGITTAILGCQLFYRVFQTVFTYSLKIIVDNALIITTSPIVMPLIAGLLITFPISVAFFLLGEKLRARTNSQIMNTMRTDIYEHLQKLPFGFYKKIALGDILARFSTDMVVVERSIALDFIPAAVAVITIFVNMATLAWINVPLALGTMALMPLSYFAVKSVLPRASQSNYRFKNAEADVIELMQENVHAQSIIRSFQIQPQMTERFQQELVVVGDKSATSNFDRSLVENASIMSFMLVQLLSTCAGAALTFQGLMTPGSLIAFASIVALIRVDFNYLSLHTLPNLLIATGGVRRIEELLHEETMAMDAQGVVPLPPFESTIHFNKVSFSSRETNEYLSEIDFTVEAGQKVALLGSSGSGKSTIFNLLLRFYDAQQGSVTIDGYNVDDVQLSSLRRQMGIVQREVFIFNGTVEKNIRVIKPEATEDEVVAVATAVGLHTFILTLPQGYQTVINETTDLLSTEERQRVALARALLRDPEILVLDGITDSLDVKSGRAIQDIVETIAQNRTLISATNNPISAAHADLIIVIDAGRIIEQGPHETLLGQRGFYYRLWEAEKNFHV